MSFPEAFRFRSRLRVDEHPGSFSRLHCPPHRINPLIMNIAYKHDIMDKNITTASVYEWPNGLDRAHTFIVRNP